MVLRTTPQGLFLVGGAAGPLAGDDLGLRLDVEAGATLAVFSAAAMLLLPGPSAAPSRLFVEASVADAGTLDWAPEPTVSVVGSRHRNAVRVALRGSAHLRWRETVVLGRHGEGPGELTARIDVTHDGVPLLRHRLEPGWLGRARCVLSEVEVPGRVASPVVVVDGEQRAVLTPLARGGSLLVALGPGAAAALDVAERVRALAQPATNRPAW